MHKSYITTNYLILSHKLQDR